ncbi:MAG: DUF1667 domain-containing protein [Firmicutes bacterium]|nr:DUF1667 domain-containing protein [Bacillota bacterium]
MNIKKEIMCIQCPKACLVAVEFDNQGSMVSVKNNLCKKGEKYALQEAINPVRILTTTVKVENKKDDYLMLPVKTDGAIPKALLHGAMRELSSVVIRNSVKIGEVVLENIQGSNINVISTGEI